jgi:glycosyltransferase involved in cell wall biosynthesis
MRFRIGRRRRGVRVLSVGSLPPELGGSERGGVATFHGVLLEEFARSPDHGVEVTGVFVLPPDELEPEGAASCPAPILAHRVPKRPGRRHLRMLRRAKPDVVVFNHITNRYVARWAVLHSRLASDVPAVGIVHSWHPITRYVSEEARLRMEFAQRGLAAVRAVSFGSHHCRAEGEALGVTYPPVAEVIHYPLQRAYAGPAEVDAGSRSGIAYMGSLIPRKNVGALIEALPALPGLELTVAGEGGEEDALRSAASRAGVADRTRFVAHHPVGEHLTRMRELLLGSAVLCLPSTSESFGLVMIEALACGTPVVGFEPTLAEIEERVGIRCGEGLPSAEPAAIAAAIERVLAREWDRAELRARTLAAFSAETVAGRYGGVLAALVGG